MPREYGPPSGDPDLGDDSTRDLEILANHIARWWGKPFAYHEIVSEYVHVDLHVVSPSEDRPNYTIITTGMSDKRMKTPEGAEKCGHCELLIELPPDWPIDQPDLDREENWWPLKHLKQTARFPHLHETWLWYGHTIGNESSLDPVAPGSPFVGFALSIPMHCDDGARKLHVRPGKEVHFFSLIPLMKPEIKYAWKRGTHALFKLLDDAAVTELLQPNRPCALPTSVGARLRARFRHRWSKGR